MENDTVRLGGMALANGVLVHGPTAWACAVRLPDGAVKVASGRKPQLAPRVQTPFVRGPVRLAEAFVLLPLVRRALPEARFPFERPRVLATVLAGSAIAGAARRTSLSPGIREAVVALASLAPAVLSLRGGEIASYHGAEHVSIGTYEQRGERASKEHDRCGSHLVGPLLVASAAANALASRAPRRSRGAARVAAAVGAVGASVEMLGWMARNPDHVVARALSRPGHLLQARLSTVEPTAEQLEVADAALHACLALENAAAAA